MNNGNRISIDEAVAIFTAHGHDVQRTAVYQAVNGKSKTLFLEGKQEKEGRRRWSLDRDHVKTVAREYDKNSGMFINLRETHRRLYTMGIHVNENAVDAWLAVGDYGLKGRKVGGEWQVDPRQLATVRENYRAYRKRPKRVDKPLQRERRGSFVWGFQDAQQAAAEVNSCAN